MERYYTINEIAAMSGLSTRTLRNYIKRGILDGEKVSDFLIKYQDMI